ncbi:LysR family transcriptional regulator (plasmid) [Ketogulonicigenium vulgare Y25]|uniref:LysR family transcriptional regulator n=1 Tax=Ketogulonicigenium vulgare (strain WSH-001) TaxID=759362 RepID=F9YBE0_KETVW|nr:LysR family transcriptional regulator [Ketogulonicigenium vulgare]ADO44255.1 LysR family transcriptional regulator [Ketogulonicigenium vulgare Y25]AEM42692.1 LysR family transcriptional regulator [Ketogulonicigenium vulgare WSH-001]ALJ82858.1 LysR family transcriptional regulator [Ketogulonicigenium vulgare]
MSRMKVPPIAALVAFQTVARCGSISSAAGMMGLTQSGVSRQIARLEDFVGAALFDRTASGVVLNAFGQDYALQVGRVMDALGTLEDTVQGARDRSQVVLACSQGVADLWVLPRLQQLRHDLPWLVLKLRVDENIALLRPDEYDLALYHRPARMADFVMEPLGPERMVPVMAPGQPPLIQQAAPLLLTMEESFKEWTDWGNWLYSAGVELPAGAMRWKMGSYRLAIEAARQGIGVAMGWTWVVQDLLDAGALVEAHPHHLEGPGHYYLLRSAQRHQRSSAKKLADWIQAKNRVLDRPAETTVTGV